MFSRLLASLCCVLLVAAASSCGSGLAGNPPENELPGQPAELAGAAAQFNAQLPALAGLPDAPRAGSVAGPGWHSIEPFVEGGFSARQNASMGAAGSLVLDGSAGLAYAVYPVHGFNEDIFPTGARLDMAAAGTGNYYVAMADYLTSRWAISGPFTGAATVSMPGLENPADSHRYVSPGGLCYLALLVEADAAFEFSSIELGVDGGSKGPRPPSMFNQPAGDTSLSIDWVHSPDYLDPDFAGYRLERAPEVFGEYEALSPELIRSTSYLDNTIEQGKGYRYRLAAEDGNGNRSNWVTFLGYSLAGSTNRPVLVTHVPAGPLYGPVEVTVDCGTDSYDPLGSPITDYYIAVVGGGILNPVDGIATVTLNPGCNVIQCTIITSDMRVNTNFTTIKVLPQWEETPRLVKDFPATTSPRWEDVSVFTSQINGLPTSLGYEPGSQSIAMWTYMFAPEGYFISRIPVYWPVDRLSNAITGDSRVLAAVSMDNRAWIANFDADGGSLHRGPVIKEPNAIDIVRVQFQYDYLFCTRNGAVSDNLVAYSLDNLANPIVIAEDVGDVEEICVCAANDDFINLFCRTTTEVRWYRLLSPDMSIFAQKQVVNSGAFTEMQCIIDPVTQRPIVMLKDLFYQYSAQDSADDFPVLQKIDAAMQQKAGGCLGSIDAAFAAFADTAGQARVYKYNGAGWDIYSELSYSANSGLEMAICDAQVDGQTLSVMDTSSDGSLNFMRVTGDGSTQYFKGLNPCLGQGSNLHASAGPSGQLHACWGNGITPTSEYAYTNDGGDNWTASGPIAVRGMKCGNDDDGNVYYSFASATSGQFFWFNGSGLVTQRTYDMMNSEAIPILCKSAGFTDTVWSAYSAGVQKELLMYGNYSTGVPAADYTETMFESQITPVWDGVVEVAGSGIRRLLRSGGLAPGNGRLVVENMFNTEYDIVAQNLYSEPVNMQTQPTVVTRGLATCSYLGGLLYLPDQAFFSTYSEDSAALRYTVDYLDNSALVKLPMYSDPLSLDARRTVSCERTPNGTGLMLLADAGGRELMFQWSNYGDWEGLPVPEVLRGKSMHEVVADLGGRWHVFYRDPLTDQVWMLSTKQS